MKRLGFFKYTVHGDEVTPGTLTKDDVNAMINGAVAKLKTEVGGMVTAAIKPFETQFSTIGDTMTAIQMSLTAQAAAPAGGKKKDDTPALDPETAATIARLEKGQKALTDQLKASEDLRVAAEKTAKATEKDSKIRTALNKFNFANPEAAEDAFTLVSGKVEFSEDGKLVADNLPLDDFIGSYIPEKKSHLLAPVGKGGAGAVVGGKGGAGAATMEMIRPGMTEAETKSVLGAIVQSLPQTASK